MPPKIIFVVVFGWAVGMMVVDCGAQLKARGRLPLVGELAACDSAHAPSRAQTALYVEAGMSMVVRELRVHGGETCYRVELPDGRQGWIPWHPARLISDGVHLGIRSF